MNTITLELHYLWPMKPWRAIIASVFPDAEQERMDEITLNVTIAEAKYDRLIGWLRERHIAWRVV